MQLLRGFGYDPILIDSEAPRVFQTALKTARSYKNPFLILKTDKGSSGPVELNGEKIAGNYLSHQIPLKNAKSDKSELATLENWLKSYDFNQIIDQIITTTHGDQYE